MKAFHFRLEAVLTLRAQAEQAAQQACARAYAAANDAAERLRAAEAAIAASDAMRREQLAKGTNSEQLEQSRIFAGLLGERRVARKRELADARLRAEDASRLLLVATQGREALERLRHRQLSQHNYQTAQTEQKILDELSAQKRPLLESWREPATEI